MREHESDGLPETLTRAVDHLRREELPSVAWRAELLKRASMRPPSPRRVTLSIPWAIAAGVLCAALGGATALVVVRHRAVTPIVVAGSEAQGAPTLPVRFSVVAPNAASVSIVGDFNRWDPVALPMRRSGDGRTWQVEVRLPVGLYAYAFMIDGRLAADPSAPHAATDDFGTTNSMLMVRGS
jgi:hypothetical protein